MTAGNSTGPIKVIYFLVINSNNILELILIRESVQKRLLATDVEYHLTAIFLFRLQLASTRRDFPFMSAITSSISVSNLERFTLSSSSVNILRSSARSSVLSDIGPFHHDNGKFKRVLKLLLIKYVVRRYITQRIEY